jgi:hypothetical protein
MYCRWPFRTTFRREKIHIFVIWSNPMALLAVSLKSYHPSLILNVKRIEKKKRFVFPILWLSCNCGIDYSQICPSEKWIEPGKWFARFDLSWRVMWITFGFEPLGWAINLLHLITDQLSQAFHKSLSQIDIWCIPMLGANLGFWSPFLNGLGNYHHFLLKCPVRRSSCA